MRVAMVSKALVVGAYQRKAEELAQMGAELTVFVPPHWRDRRGSQPLEHSHTAGYTLRVIPLRFNGNFHLHYYPTLPAELRALRPAVLHMDEEPYNLATWLALRAAARLGIRATFFTWQNLNRRYPPPFAALERAVYRLTPLAIAGSRTAAEVLAQKGFGGEVAVIPQFGVDPTFFQRQETPAANTADPAPLRIGFAGGLLREKGVDLLLRACAGLTGPWQLLLAGEGEERVALAGLARDLGIDAQVEWLGRIAGDAMPPFYHALDVLALPSRSLPNWKEQFGRVLIEAMACEVPVVGSDSGEIPHVVGEGGLIFPEDDIAALQTALQTLADDGPLRRRLGAGGRRRVLAHYTMRHIAEQTLAVYTRLAGWEDGSARP